MNANVVGREILQATAKTTAGVQAKAAGRFLYVDNLRIFLTALVLLHHTMIVYAWSGGWIYKEGSPDFITTTVGSWFCAVNQAFFMGLFFLVSAYFVVGAYARKGSTRFWKDRLLRLGIPLVIYTWIIHPIFVYQYLRINDELSQSFQAFYSAHFLKFFGVFASGPLWFVEALLIFTAGYSLYRLLTRSSSASQVVDRPLPGNRTIALFALLLGLAGFLVRVKFPIDYNFEPLNLQFPFFAQYIALFIVGLVAYRRNWLKNLSDVQGRAWLRIGIGLSLLFIPMALLVGATEDVSLLKGGWHWQAAVYAVWESFTCLGLSIGLIYAFRRYFNGQGMLAKTMGRSAYTAYIIQAPVITFVALAIRDVNLYPLVKFGLAALIILPVSFLLSSLLRKLPYAERVL